MPAIAATKNSWGAPSIGQMLSAIPKIMVGYAVVFSGISNACGSVLGSPHRHGGGLETEAHARWQSHWRPEMQRCLSEQWTHHFEPDRSIVACLLRGIDQWQQDSKDIYATEVVTRSLAQHQLPSSGLAADAPGPTPRALKRRMHKINKAVHSTPEYERAMMRTNRLLWFHTPESWSTLVDTGKRYTADSLTKLLNDNGAVNSFMEEAAPLSFELHEMLRKEGKRIYQLKPELMRSKADLAALEKRLDHNYVAPDARMSNHQLRVLLSLQAAHMNEKNSRMVS